VWGGLAENEDERPAEGEVCDETGDDEQGSCSQRSEMSGRSDDDPDHLFAPFQTNWAGQPQVFTVIGPDLS
jgi:hypothetical protein